jgi:hypothetical protein
MLRGSGKVLGTLGRGAPGGNKPGVGTAMLPVA